MEAQYDVLRKRGHSQRSFQRNGRRVHREPDPARRENGMDWMYANCSATAQRALDWKPRFKKAVMPVFNELLQKRGLV